FIAAGYSLSGIGMDKSEASRGWEDIWIVRLDASGSKIWDKTIGGNDQEGHFNYNWISVVPILIEQTSDQGYLVGGYSKSGISGDKTSPNKGAFDYWIVKLAA